MVPMIDDGTTSGARPVGGTFDVVVHHISIRIVEGNRNITILEDVPVVVTHILTVSQSDHPDIKRPVRHCIWIRNRSRIESIREVRSSRMPLSTGKEGDQAPWYRYVGCDRSGFDGTDCSGRSTGEQGHRDGFIVGWRNRRIILKKPHSIFEMEYLSWV